MLAWSKVQLSCDLGLVIKDREGRYELRVTLSGVERGRGVLWHDVLRLYFRDNGRIPSFAAFRELLKNYLFPTHKAFKIRPCHFR